MTVPPRWVKAAKGAACLLFVGHMAATCAPHVPAQSALHPASVPFVHYQELTGLWQAWDMFTTIPYYHAYSIDILVTEPDGALERAGVELPGLRAFDHTVRTETFFSRVLYDQDSSPYLSAYAEKACAEIRLRAGHGGQKILLHESVERLRWLEQIRDDGVLSSHEDHASKIFSCAG